MQLMDEDVNQSYAANDEINDKVEGFVDYFTYTVFANLYPQLRYLFT